MNAVTVTRKIRIHGHVQGVWYRAWTVQTARELGLVGWVRNCADGTVEALVQGDENAVEQLVTLAEDGSPMAQVERVESVDCDPISASSFEQR